MSDYTLKRLVEAHDFWETNPHPALPFLPGHDSQRLIYLASQNFDSMSVDEQGEGEWDIDFGGGGISFMAANDEGPYGYMAYITTYSPGGYWDPPDYDRRELNDKGIWAHRVEEAFQYLVIHQYNEICRRTEDAMYAAEMRRQEKGDMT